MPGTSLSSELQDQRRLADPLPRGPHRLTREQVGESQRLRLERAFVELLAERGYAGVTIGELARRARVSRGAFYEQFADKEACLFSAYDRFAGALLEAMSTDVTASTTWSEFVRTALGGYLGTLERDRVAARAFLVEMDSAGRGARQRRRGGIEMLATMLRERHEAIRAGDASLAPIPEPVYLGLCLGVRELVRERLEAGDPTPLTDLAPAIVFWATATVRGAAAARDELERP
jgi:AcrR family transcriptional regulator